MSDPRVELVETVEGEWMVLVNGFQWGIGPYDRSGVSSQTWATRIEAEKAFEQRNEQ